MPWPRSLPAFWADESAGRRTSGIVLLRQLFSDPADEIEGQWVLVRERQIALGSAIEREFPDERRRLEHWRIDADVFFEGCKIEKDTTLPERRHFVRDAALRPRYPPLHLGLDRLQPRANFGGGSRVEVGVMRRCVHAS